MRVAGLPIVVCAALASGLLLSLPHALSAQQRKEGGAAVLSLARCNGRAANGCREGAGGGGGSPGLEWADLVRCGTASLRRRRIQWERLAHRQAQRRVVRVGCATRGTNHDAATSMLSVSARVFCAVLEY